MAPSRSRRNKPSPRSSVVGSPSPVRTSRKRAASPDLSVVSGSESDDASSARAKRAKQAAPASVVVSSEPSPSHILEGRSESTTGEVSDAGEDDDEASKVVEKRRVFPTEKKLYMSKTTPAKLPNVDKKRSPAKQLSPEAPYMETATRLQDKNKKGRQAIATVDISSDENDNHDATPTPKAKQAVGTSTNRKVPSTPSRSNIVAPDEGTPARIRPRPLKQKTKPQLSEDDVFVQPENPSRASTPAQSESASNDPFVIVPAKMDMRAEYCPSALMVDGCPVELSRGALEFFDENASRNMNSAISFKSLLPFANISALTAGDVSVDNFRHDVLWDGSSKPVVFTMLASVHSSNIIQPLQLKNYKIKSLTVIPFGDSWRKFEKLLGSLYGTGEMQGPFEYGCLLRLTSRREGGFSGGVGSSTSSALAATPQKNLKAFASSRPTPSALWFEKKQSSCVNFTDDIPIYDASNCPFLFQRDDFASMQGLPRYKKYGVRSWSDLPHQSLASVFFTLNTYPKDYSSSSGAESGFSGPSPAPTRNNSVLSFNLHSVVYYGVIPDE